MKISFKKKIINKLKKPVDDYFKKMKSTIYDGKVYDHKQDKFIPYAEFWAQKNNGVGV